MRLVCFLVLFLSLACQTEDATLPLPMEKAAAIMLDVHTAENAVLTLYGTRKDSFLMRYYDQIYTIHQIDSTTLNELLFTVRNNPELSRDLYQEARRQFDEQYPDNR
ncbi:MAG TPA: DUF4296 domain-containing protein [Saprospiraceae bacterium]|nr:DUF4296 domain-containing protein [Saprospiraceae bacterium]